jgi:hypothetical protein
VRQTGVATLSAIAESIPAETKASPDLQSLAELLYLSAGITRQRKYPGGELYFRAAACTGALYEVELYLVCGDLVDLEAGVYHFAPASVLKLKPRLWQNLFCRMPLLANSDTAQLSFSSATPNRHPSARLYR